MYKNIFQPNITDTQMLTGEITAKVNGNHLDCYDWEDGDELEIVRKVDCLDVKNGQYLYEVFNWTKHEHGSAATFQMVETS